MVEESEHGPESTKPTEEPPPEATAEPEAEVAETEAGSATSSADEPGRRKFLATATVCLGACAGAGVLGVVGAAVVGTPLTASNEGAGWFDLGPLERFPKDASRKIAVVGEKVDAWNKFAAVPIGRVVVVRKGEDLKVFSAVCPHNGCDVFVAKAELICPCHDSTFGQDGALLSGESPRGLDPLEHEVKEGRLRVRYQRFALGTPERTPLK